MKKAPHKVKPTRAKVSGEDALKSPKPFRVPLKTLQKAVSFLKANEAKSIPIKACPSCTEYNKRLLKLMNE